MNKTLLVLAASAYQLPTIKTAKRLGWRVITADNVVHNPGHSLADASYRVDTTDQAGVLTLARQIGIDGIIAPGTDIAVTTAAYVAETLNLPGPTLSAAKILTHKLAFRQFMQAAGLPTPGYLRVNALTPLDPTLFEKTTWIIKPNRASGSKGIYILSGINDFNERCSTAVAFSIDDLAVLEEYFPGTQHTCEGVLQEGQVRFSLITDRDTTAPPYTATTGHRVPTLLGTQVQLKIQRMIEKVFKALELVNTPFDCDFIAHHDSVAILEITPRLGGNSLSNLIQVAHDFDIVEYAVKQACGISALLPSPRPPAPAAIVILGVADRGALHFNAAAAETLRQENWVHSLILDYALGDPVEPFTHGRQRVGEALIRGETRQELGKKVDRLRTTLALTTQ